MGQQQDWGQNFPLDWVILFLVHRCFLKGKQDCCVCLLSPGGRVWKKHLTVPRWTGCILSGTHKSQENQLQDQPRGHTSTAPTARGRNTLGCANVGFSLLLQELISTEFYRFSLSPWALWLSFVTSAHKKCDFQESNEALDKLSS